MFHRVHRHPSVHGVHLTGRVLAVACLALAAAGCGGGPKPTPAAPSTPTATRIIGLSGSLDFGTVTVGLISKASFLVSNSGNTTLTIAGFTFPATGAFTLNWAGGSIAAGESKAVTIQFAPTQAMSYDGMLTVYGDQTSGANTLPVSAVGLALPAGAAPFVATSWCGAAKAGTYAGLACIVVVTPIGSVPPGLQAFADLSAFGMSRTWNVPRCSGPCGQIEFDLDLHVPADMPAGAVPVNFTVTDAAGHSFVTTATMQITR